MSDAIRIWIARRLLGAAWIVLPKWHSGWRGIADAAVAIATKEKP